MIEYEEDYWVTIIPTIEGSVIHKSIFLTIPSIILSILFIYLDEWQPGLREDWGLLEARSSQLWTATTSIMAFMIMFRTRQAFARFWEGTGLLHQMRGEWFDTVSNCVTFSITARPSKPEEVTSFRHTIIRIMSLCHGSALEEIAGNNIQLESIDTFGLDDGTLNHLQECHNEYGFNKVEVMLHLLQSLITTAHHEGVLHVPPPILSRVYQTISRGFVNLLNAKKIQDTKFPFPYAQLIAFLLVVLAIVTPLMMSILVQNKFMAGFFTFMPMFGLYCLNFAAIELEDPFGTDDNDLPLEHFQTEMNNCLMMLLHPNTDLIATVSDRCEMDFHTLRKQVCLNENDLEEVYHDVSDGAPVRQKTRRLSEFDINDPSRSQSLVALGSQAVEELGGAGDMVWNTPPTESQRLEAQRTMEFENKRPRRTSQNSGGSQQDSVSRGTLSSHNSGESTGENNGWSAGQRSGLGVRVTSEEEDASSGEQALQMDSLTLFVGKEGSSGNRMAARTQEPMAMLHGNEDIKHSRYEAAGSSSSHAQFAGRGNRTQESESSGFNEMTDLQPILARNMEDLISSLDAWTKNVNKEVDALQSNSVILQNALQKFNDGLPKMKAKVAALR